LKPIVGEKLMLCNISQSYACSILACMLWINFADTMVWQCSL